MTNPRRAGHRFNTLNSRIAFAFMLYNAERILCMKPPPGHGRANVAVYKISAAQPLGRPFGGRVCSRWRAGLYTPGEYGQLIAERERNRIVDTPRQGLARGESLERLLDRLKDDPPREA